MANGCWQMPIWWIRMIYIDCQSARGMKRELNCRMMRICYFQKKDGVWGKRDNQQDIQRSYMLLNVFQAITAIEDLMFSPKVSHKWKTSTLAESDYIQNEKSDIDQGKCSTCRSTWFQALMCDTSLLSHLVETKKRLYWSINIIFDYL